ncbi:MAG TPA: hypothetical protein VND64_04460 [Pirellulales bacterium]|nr:hypothetical protein [Pirellulales bacterium]
MRNDPRWKPHFDWVYGKRPREELYDLKADPQQIMNVAADAAYAKTRAELEQELLTELQRTGDPRLVDDGRFFETPPLSGPANGQPPAARKEGQRQLTASSSACSCLVRRCCSVRRRRSAEFRNPDILELDPHRPSRVQLERSSKRGKRNSPKSNR